MNNKKEYILLFTYHLRKNLPHSQLFYSLLNFFKFIGLILISHNVSNLEDGVYNMSQVFISLTIYGRGYKQYVNSYLSVLVIFFFFMVGMFLLTFITILIIKRNHGRSLYDKLLKYELFLVKVIAFACTLIAFCSQHLIEYFALGILDVTLPKMKLLGNNAASVDYIFLTFCITNVVISEVTSISFFYLSKSFSSVSPIGDPYLISYSISDLSLIIIPSLQGVFALHNINETSESYHYYLNIFLAILLFLNFIFQFKTYNYYDSNFSLFFEKFLLYFCFISSLDELILCHLCKTPFNQSVSFCKLTLELLNAFIFTKLNIMYINSIYINGFVQKVFSDKQKLSSFDLLAYVKEIVKFKNQEITFSNIFQMFSLHKEHCSLPKCPCHYLSAIKWISQVKASQSPAQYEIEEKEVISTSYEDFVILGEHEITKMIYYYYKSKENSSILDRLIVLHIEYVMNVKRKLWHTLYLTSQYLIINNDKMSFMTQLTLYEFKLITFDQLTNERKKKTKEELCNHLSSYKCEKLKNFERMDLFYNHTKTLEKIRQLLITCCDLLSKLLDFCKAIEIKTTGRQKKCEYFFGICQNYQKNHTEICKILSTAKSKIKHYEISYMLTTYFNSSIGYIPEKLQNCFKTIDSYDYFVEKQEYNSYKQFNQINPMMIFINPNDEFIIKYISISLCSHLNYKRQELLNGEFSQLLPKELAPLHNIMLKKYVLSSKKSYKNHSFIFDKERNMISAKLSFSSILTLENNFGIIISADFSFKESPDEKDYFLLLDKDMMIISMNKAFPENFHFTLPIFQFLKMSFCTFFGISQDRIAMKVKSLLNTNTKHAGSMEQANKVLTVFSQRKSETMFADIKATEYNHMTKTKKVTLHDKIPMKGIIKNLDTMNKMIEELGLDIEWYSRVNCLREKLELMKSVDIESNYSIVNIEDLIYIIVNLKEKHLILRSLMDNNLTANCTKKNDGIESPRSGQRLSNSKMKSNRSITNGSENMDMNSTTKLRIGQMHHPPILFQPGQSLKKDGTISGSSANSMLILNRTSIVLLNSSDNGKRKNRNNNNNKEFSLSVITYETRELFAFKILQKYLHYSYKLLGISIFILSLLPFIFNSSFMDQSKDLYSITLYSLMLKSNIYFSSLEILTSCEKAEANDLLSLNEQKSKLLSLGNEMIDHFTIFSKTLNSLAKSPIQKIFDLINTDNDYAKLMKNFETTIKSSAIFDELFFIHYYLIQLSDETSFASCRLKYVFINKHYEKLIDTVPGPNYEETIIYYIMSNVLFSLTAKMEELTEVTHEIIQLHFKNCKSTILLYDCLLMLLSILLGGSFVSIIDYNKTNMQILLNMIYTKYSNETKFELKVKAFRLFLEEFCSNNCQKFEEIKKTLPERRQTTDLSVDKPSSKRKKTRISNLTKAMSLKTLGQSIKRYSNELTTPKQVKFSVGITIFFIGLFIVIIVINVILSKKLYDNLMFAIVISINYINRIPKICELFLYTKVSMIFNDVNYITTPLSSYNNRTFSNYYNITLDTHTNTMFSILRESKFAFLYYQLLQIQGNLEEFNSRSKSTAVLDQLTQWENLFNTKEGLCIYGALGFYSIENNSSNSVSLIENISKDVTKCRLYGNGMTKNTLNAYIDFSTQQLKNIYVDFATFDLLIRDPMMFLSQSSFSSIGSITTGPLKHIHDTVMYYLESDLNKICSNNNLISLIVSLVLMFLSLGVFLYVHFFLIHQIENNINTLTFIQDINAKAQ